MQRATNRLKTVIHDALSWKALRWAASRATYSGIRGGVEVRLAQGYIADTVCLARFQHRFADAYCRHSNLTLAGCRFRGGKWEEYGDIQQEWLMIFEAKRTRADFRKTFGDTASPRHTPIGNAHWCVTPKGLIQPVELPEWWGLLVERGNGLHEVRKPKVFVVDDMRLYEVAHELMWNHATTELAMEQEPEVDAVALRMTAPR